MKIVKVRPEERYSTKLERLARSITDAQIPGTSMHLRGIKHQMALVLDHMATHREICDRQHRSLVHAECYVNTEIMGLNVRFSKYSSEVFSAREKLRRKLADIETERRKLWARQETERRALDDQLLALILRHDLLSAPGRDGY